MPANVICKACAGEWPATDHLIADLDMMTAYLFDDQFFPGWTVLVLKRHATELFHLTTDERGQLIEDVSRVATALAMAFEPVKINYELLGNQLSHIHWHIIPRLAGDPAPREAVWTVKHEPKRLPPDELHERISLLRTHLKK
ncbi:MAG: HIT family protein [Nitrospirae bacterium]|nr:MAG: HIT family protein [Nitrospirota bacterium]